MLIGQNILATAAKEVEHVASTAAEDASKNTGENRSGTKQDELSTSTTAGLDADGFVRVCIHLLRDNFLVKVGFDGALIDHIVVLNFFTSTSRATTHRAHAPVRVDVWTDTAKDDISLFSRDVMYMYNPHST